MLFKLWIKIFCITVSMFFLFIMTLNFIVNPYHIFNETMFSKYFPQKSHHASKQMSNFYIAKHSQPQNLMMGSSRIQMFPKTDVQKYLKTSTYNMAMSGATIEEQTQYLGYMIENHKIHNIIWALDFFSFNPDRKNNPNFSYDRLDNSSFIKNDYKTALLSLQTTKNSIKTIQDNLKLFQSKKKVKPLYLIKQEFNKKYSLLANKTIDQQTEQTLLYYKKKMLNNQHFTNAQSITKNIKKVQKIIELCQKKNIKLYIYLSPVQSSMLNLYTELGLENTFLIWKKSLQEITSYIDFCTLNSITNNRYNFIDGAHIMPRFSKLIFARIFNDTSVDIPNDFGVSMHQSKFE